MSTKIFLTTGTSWTVPSDWNNSNNTIELIGAGGNGSSNGGTSGGSAGGAGGYAKVPNLNLTVGSTVTYQIGTVGVPGTDTYFNGSSLVSSSLGCAAATNAAGLNPGIGSTGVSLIGTATLFKGGNGGTITAQHGGAGGGGAAGPNGAGVAGAGDSGSNTGATGGNADNGSGGAGGTTGNPGGNGTEFDGIHGAGGGGGGGSQGGPTAGSGGTYGGGGGGAQISSASVGAGQNGLIVITYTSIFTTPRYWVGGTGNWDASTTTHWSATSGGAGGASVPTSANDVVFDFNSGSGTTTVTAAANCNSLNTVAFTGTINLSNQIITLTGSGNVWNLTIGFTLISGTSTIKLTDATSSSKTFNGMGLIYSNIFMTGSGTGAYTITGSNTFNDFKVDTPPHTVNFTEGTTQTLTTFTVNGTAGNLMTLQSTAAGLPWFLHKATTGTISCDYLSLQDSHVS